MPIHRQHLPKFPHYCFDCLKTTDHYADNENMVAYCGACDKEVTLRAPIKTRVDLRGYRPFEGRLESALMIIENLYGHRTLYKSDIEEPVDILIDMVERYYIDWNTDSKTFRELVNQVYGENPPKTSTDWQLELTKSKNNHELVKMLMDYTAHGPPKTAPELEPEPSPKGWGTVSTGTGPQKKAHWMKPGVIHMKRGTVIPADHIIEYSGPGNYKYPTKGKPVNVVLAGLDYDPTHFSKRWMTQHSLEKRLARRSDLYEKKSTKYPNYLEYKQLFKQILTMLPRNVARIDYT